MNVRCYGEIEGTPAAPVEEITGLIRCRIRHKWLVATPEEFVRQALLRRLMAALEHEAMSGLEIVVEGASLDIAIYPPSLDDLFQPDIPPLLIIETKRRDIQELDSPSHEHQLLGYLRRTGCRDGVLANCEQLWHYQRLEEGHSKVELTSFEGLVNLIRTKTSEAQQNLQEHEQWFNRARAGSFEDFRRLVELYGRSADSTIKFIYEQRGQLSYVSGFLFHINDEQIHCMPRGQAVQKKLTFSAGTFHRLHSIISLRRRTQK